MSDESFVHDESQFEPAAASASIQVSEAESQYADVVAEVIWDGIITAEERKRLTTASELFGLTPARATQIEQALTAAYEARHKLRVLDKSDGPEGEASSDRASLAPLAPAADPRLHALQRRITVVERRNQELARENQELRELTRRLEAQTAELRKTLAASGKAGSQGAAEESPSPGQGAEPFWQARTGKWRPAGGLVAAEISPPTSASPVSAPPASVSPVSTPPASASPVSAPPASVSPVSTPPASGPPPVITATALGRASRGDPAQIHRLVRRSPRDVELLRALFNSLARSDDVDRRWCIAHALVYLGEANDQERAAAAAPVTTDIVRPSRAVNKDEWVELLAHPEQDHLTGEILAEIAPAVVLSQLAALRHEGSAPARAPSPEVDPHKSRLEAVRCLAWASAFLGLVVPPLTVAPDDPGTLELVLSPKPALRLGRQALVGRSGKELAFMAGRHLAWHRKEHILGKLAGTVRRLEDLFLAALMIGNPGLPMTEEIKQRVEPIVKAITPLLDPLAIERLQGCFGRFVEQGGRTNLVTWLHAVDRTAACTGLLLANDLRAAETMLRIEDPERCAARMDELIVFFTAGRCSLLRKRIGISFPS